MGWRMALWIVLVGVAVYFLYLVRNVVFPFALALLISAMLEPMCRRLHKRGFSWGLSVWTIWLTLSLACLGLVIYFTPTVSRQVITFRDKIEGISGVVAAQTAQDNYFLRWNPRNLVATDATYRQIDRVFSENSENLKRLGLPSNRRMATSQYIEPFRQDFTNGLQDFFRGFLGAVGMIGSNAFLYGFVPFLVLMILLDLERFKQKASAMVPPSIRADTVELLSDVFNVFVRYLRGLAIVIVWYFVLAALLLSLMGAPYSILLAGVFALVYLVPLIGGLLNIFLLFVLTGLSGKTDSWYYSFPNAWAFAAAVTIVYWIVFTFFDPLVYTRIVGNSVGLHPLISFFVVFSAGALFGPVGMIAAFPVAGAVKIILDRLLLITSKPQDLHLPPIPLRHRLG